MIRTRLLLGVSAIFLMAASPEDLSPRGYVNDFANVIPDNQESQIERKLAEFDRTDTVQISVVTVSSLDDRDIETWSTRLFDHWGIGHADTNNGLLIVIAPTERTYRIEVGYGLESTITDAESGQWGRDILRPAFRRNDYAGGIDGLVNVIIGELSTTLAGQRAEFVSPNTTKRTTAAEDTASRAIAWETVLNFFGGGLLLGGGAYGTLRIRRRIKQRRERRRLLESLLLRCQSLRTELQNASTRLKASPYYGKEAKEALPDWAKKYAEQNVALVTDMLPRMLETITSVEGTADTSFSSAQQLLQSVSALKADILTALANLEEIPEKVAEMKQKAEQSIAQLGESVRLLDFTVGDLLKQGYLLGEAYTQAEVEKIKAAAADLKQQLASCSKDAHDDLLQAATALRDSVDEKLQTLMSFEAVSTSAIKVLDSCKCFDAVHTAATEYKTLRSRLMQSLPEARLEAFPVVMPLSRESLQERVQQLNASDARNIAKVNAFSDAVATLRSDVNLVPDLLAQLKELERGFQLAQQQHASKLSRLSSAIEDANQEIGKGDAGNAAKQSLSSAESQFRKIQQMESSSVIDWIAVAGLLDSAITNAAEASTQAKRNRKAEDERRREEERRRREEEEEEERQRRRRADDASSSSSPSGWSSSSSSSSSDSGFGGFGGGDSGGGGSSGTW